MYIRRKLLARRWARHPMFARCNVMLARGITLHTGCRVCRCYFGCHQSDTDAAPEQQRPPATCLLALLSPQQCIYLLSCRRFKSAMTPRCPPRLTSRTSCSRSLPTLMVRATNFDMRTIVSIASSGVVQYNDETPGAPNVTSICDMMTAGPNALDQYVLVSK